jgi:putative lipoprotein
MGFKKGLALLILTLTLLLTGCDNTSNKAAITGTLDHSHWMALPDGTMIILRIEDTTKQDAPGKKVAESVIKSEGDTIPMPFAVVYDPGKINDNHKYSLTVKIEDSSGKIMYINQSDVPVLTQGNPTHDLDVIVVLPGE